MAENTLRIFRSPILSLWTIDSACTPSIEISVKIVTDRYFWNSEISLVFLTVYIGISVSSGGRSVAGLSVGRAPILRRELLPQFLTNSHEI